MTALCPRLLALAAGLLVTAASHAQSVRPEDTPDASLEQQRQLQRTEALRRQQEQGADVRRPEAPPADTGRLAESEQPCFTIDRIEVSGVDADSFGWLIGAAAGVARDDSPIGRCLGGKSINQVLKRMQNALIHRGYITSQLSVPSQDLKSGTLKIALLPGRIDAIRHAEPSDDSTSLQSAMPATGGEVLQLRDIEQALENLKRVPSAEANIEIHPAGKPGHSDLVFHYRQADPLRITLAADDGGLKATGKYQGSATIAYDNPLGLNDLFYVALHHDLVFDGRSRGNHGGLLHYSVPFGYWSAGLTVSRSRDHQNVQGATVQYIYSGASNNAELTLSRIVHRDASSKTSLSAGAFRRTSRNFIDDTEVEVQRRQVAGWLVAANHRRFVGLATVDATLQYKRGTRAFGAIPAPEEAFGEGTGLFEKTHAALRLSMPFKLAGRSLSYFGALRAQWNHSRLTPQDKFVIGGRYTVRGFDGESVLSAERGWLLRNELAMPLADTGASIYLGLDYGEVGGPSSDALVGKRLAGAVLGLRGGYRKLSYEVFFGGPLSQPERFDTPDLTGGFRVAYTH